MNIEFGCGISLTGHYIVEKGTKKDGVTERREFDNLVLDVGWDKFISVFFTAGWALTPQWLYLGTSAVEPAANQTGLLGLSALPAKYWTTRSRGGELNRGNHVAYSSAFLRFDYGEGEAQGVWTELGLAYGDTYTEPYNRSLFRDELGNAQALTVLADEFVRIFVELRLHWPTEVKTGTFIFNGTPTTWTYNLLAFLTSSACPWEIGMPATWLVRNDTNATPNYSYGISANGMTTTIGGDPLTREFTFFKQVGDEFKISSLTFGKTCTVNQCSPIIFHIVDRMVKPFDYQMTGSGSISFYRAAPVLDSGAATAATLTTLEDTTKTWTVNEWVGETLKIISGEGAEQSRTILSNTADTLTVADWVVTPNATSRYEIRSAS